LGILGQSIGIGRGFLDGYAESPHACLSCEAQFDSWLLFATEVVNIMEGQRKKQKVGLKPAYRSSMARLNKAALFTTHPLQTTECARAPDNPQYSLPWSQIQLHCD
jgi:hypothetical protein